MHPAPLTTILLAACTLALSSCAMNPAATRTQSPPEIESGTYHPPPIFFADLSAARTSVRVTLEFPHPGWGYILDAERTTSEARELYFTIYRPDPRSFFPMVIKRERADFSLDGAPTAIIYARTIAHDLRDIDKPYRFAAEAR